MNSRQNTEEMKTLLESSRTAKIEILTEAKSELTGASGVEGKLTSSLIGIIDDILYELWEEIEYTGDDEDSMFEGEENWEKVDSALGTLLFNLDKDVASSIKKHMKILRKTIS